MTEIIKQTNWVGGANNVAQPDRLPDGFVAGAVNLDFTSQGGVRGRAGYELAASLGNAWGVVPYGETLLIADGAILKQFDTLSNSLADLAAIAEGGFFTGAELNGEAFICTQTQRIRVSGDQVLPWGVEPVAFRARPIAGRLVAGLYRVAVTIVTEDGIESGALPVTMVLPDGSGIEITCEVPLGAAEARIYSSVANGETLYLQGELLMGQGKVDLARDDTARLGTENLVAPPLGDTVVSHNGRLLIANGATLAFTEPFMPHHHHRIRGFIRYAAPISVVLSVGGRVVVVADKTYVVSAIGTSDQQQSVPLNLGGVKGSGVVLPDGSGRWMTKYGQAVAGLDGSVTLPNRGSFAPALTERGAAGVIEHRGEQIVVTTLRGQQQGSTLGLNDFFEAEFEP